MSYNPFYTLENPELMRYEYAWVNFIKNNKETEYVVRPEILKSWKRCREMKLDYMVKEVPDANISGEIFSKKVLSNRELLNVALPFMETLVKIVSENSLSTQIVDKEGYVLKSLGEMTKEVGGNEYYQIGASTKEEVIGTNAVSQVMLSHKPEEVIGSEHYLQILHKTLGYAAPIFNGNNELVAILTMNGWVEFVSKHILGMVTAAAKAIENELKLHEVQRHIIQQNNEREEILETVTNGVLYVNESEVITQLNSEMVKMLGMRKENIIGKSVNFINIAPQISSIINSNESNQRFEVTIYGTKKIYNCFLTCRQITRETGSKNRVLVFTKMEEIQELAHQLNNESRAFFSFKDIMGKSELLNQAKDLARKASMHGSRVIIEGESGTGKEMFAQAIHNNGKRSRRPFIAVDCGAIPRELLESELFGYEEGAFTGARKGGQRGKFEQANGGTIFLDEISNMPIDMQAKLLRVLQENCIYRIGSGKPIATDVQVIAASNSDLERDAKNKNFREDLFYRLNVIYIKLPALRERREDINFLLDDYVNKMGSSMDKKIVFDENVLTILNEYDWPGNIRQLHNAVERMVIMAEDGTIRLEHVPNEITGGNVKKRSLEDIGTLEQTNAKYIKEILDFCHGNIKKTSEKLEISRTTIYRVLKKYGYKI